MYWKSLYSDVSLTIVDAKVHFYNNIEKYILSSLNRADCCFLKTTLKIKRSYKQFFSVQVSLKMIDTPPNFAHHP